MDIPQSKTSVTGPIKMEGKHTLNHSIQNNIPRLRRNRKAEQLWGMRYHSAVKETVFGLRTVPHIPGEPPPSSIRDLVDSDPLYVCKQCNDCFRIKSNYEDHCARRSWILGYWCQYCFLTICTHRTSPTDGPCASCTRLEYNKRKYLRSKADKKKIGKLGATRVFYNQCQFFAHLSTHKLSLVDMGDIMLMPFPFDIGNEYLTELDKLCEALMEHSFLLKVHVMDWLKAEKVGNDWWRAVSDKVDESLKPVLDVLKKYQGKDLFKTVPGVIIERAPSTASTVAEKNDTEIEIVDEVSGEKSLLSDVDQNVLEHEDNPCTSTDITFVDCGPSPKFYAPEALPSMQPGKTISIDQYSFDTPKRSILSLPSEKQQKLKIKQLVSGDWMNTTMSYGNTTITPRLNSMNHTNTSKDLITLQLRKDITKSTGFGKARKTIKLAPKQAVNRLAPEKIGQTTLPALLSASLKRKLKICKKPGPSSERQSFQTVSANANSKILTFQGPKNVDFNTIFSQLPPHLINNRKIVFIGQDADRVAANNKQNAAAPKGASELASNSNHGKIMKTIPAKVVPVQISPMLNNGNKKNLQKIQPKGVQKTFEKSIICQNGKNFIIKSTSDMRNVKEDLSTTPIISKIIRPVRRIAPKTSAASKSGVGTPVNNNSIVSSGITVKSTASLQNDLLFPTPSPSPSESSNSSNYDVQGKQTTSAISNVEDNEAHSLTSDAQNDRDLESTNEELSDTVESEVPSSSDVALSRKPVENAMKGLSLRPDDSGHTYLEVNETCNMKINIVAAESLMMPRCRDDMIHDFCKLSRTEIIKRIEHFEELHKEYPKLMSFLNEGTIKKNAKAINTLIYKLKDLEGRMEYNPEEKSDDQEEPFLLEWETKLKELGDKAVCEQCKKIIKLPIYVPGFSKPAADESAYCACYRHICTECGSYEGKYTHFKAHQNYHKKARPFTCPDCCKLFRSYKYLEAHTWSTCYHILKKRVFGCKVCQVDGFVDMESLARHFVLMHSYKKLACEKCRMVLPSYSAYKNHVNETHTPSSHHNPIRLVVCKIGDCVVPYKNYISHLEEHVCVRKVVWFKCPFCPFYCLTTKRNLARLTPHLHVKHFDKLSDLISIEALSTIDKQALVRYKVYPKELFDEENTSRCKEGEEIDEDDTVVIPKIVNARTISSEMFENGTNSAEAVMNDALKKTKTADEHEREFRRNSPVTVTSAAADSSSHNDSDGPTVLPKILNVESMAVFTQEDKDRRGEDSEDINCVEKAGERDTEMLNEFTGEFEPAAKDRSMILEPGASDKIGKVSVAEFSKTSFGDDPSSPSQRKHVDPEIQLCVVSESQIQKKEGVELSVDDSTDVSMECESIDEVPPPTVALRRFRPTKTNFVSSTPSAQSHDVDADTEVIAAKTLKVENIDNDSPVKEMRLPVLKSRQPPPLARIPKYVHERSEFQLRKLEMAAEKESMNVQSSANHESNFTKPLRLALNEPNSANQSSVDYLCHLCGEKINTSWPIASEHFKSKHPQCALTSITPSLVRMSADFINGGYKELQGKKRKSDGTTSLTKRRRRWTPKKHSDAKDTSGLGLCVKQETAEDSEGNFICKKCNRRCSDIKDLRDHIASSHRIKGRYLICLECGENFVVSPSLQMHLKAFHGIEDPITYLTQNTAYAPDVTDDLENEGKASVGNQCHVCMAVFEHKAAVDKHLRVHGMAFLNRKRIEARNALKNPEIKSLSEEDKLIVKTEQAKFSPVKDGQKEPSNAAETILEKISAII